jgi:transposase
LRAEALHQPPLVEQAMAEQASAYLRQVRTATQNADRLQTVMTARFEQYPDAGLITSLPGLGAVLGARALGELGDDRARFADAKGVKAFAGTAPVTRASGTKHVVAMRVVRNKRLGQVAYLWAFSLLRQSPGARAHYDRRRAAGDSHAVALRNLANRFIGILYHCLQTGERYDETGLLAPRRRRSLTTTRRRMSSPTAPPSSASSAPCSPSNTTNAPRCAATSV